MIAISQFAGRTVAVYGLARSGISAAQALLAGGARVVAWDDKEEARRAGAELGITIADLGSHDWSDIAALILSPGVPLTHPAPHLFVTKAKAAGAEVIGDMELFARALAENTAGAKVVAVTGTNGKSTTTALIGHILSRLGFNAQVGGNIGHPVLDLAPPAPGTVYVIELSSFQLDLAPSLKPDVAVLINITPDHLDRHGSMEHYAEVKGYIFRHQTRNDVAVIGVDDPYSAALCTQISSHSGPSVTPVSIGKVLGRGIFVLDGKLYDASGATTREVRDLHALINLPGAHNWQNIAAAYAATRPLVKDPRDIAGAIATFPGLAHRIEQVGSIGRVRFVNDSKATNADAAAKALACYDDVYWIAGGKPKEGGIESLAPFFPRIRKAYLIGAATNRFADTLTGHVDVDRAGTLEAAMRHALTDAAQVSDRDAVVLLSPACASFDQFRDFEHRGDEFKRLYAVLAEEARLQGAA
ncbi:MAG: UDP-N-acetylmuramoyl-L-alanine--D-glutamate ligase [Alphaproteobacteria bacterium]|nr:UDP-N-acetylmuramoyl-L-alanine--D-glutamate ligase [Alphaproteobacteria bacterium]